MWLFLLFNFLDEEEPATGPVFGPLDPPTEIFTLDVQEVCAFFEVENLDQTVPLLCIRTSVDGKVSNWTKQVYALFLVIQLYIH